MVSTQTKSTIMTLTALAITTSLSHHNSSLSLWWGRSEKPQKPCTRQIWK